MLTAHVNHKLVPNFPNGTNDAGIIRMRATRLLGASALFKLDGDLDSNSTAKMSALLLVTTA